ncbi:MAG: ferritin [Acidobacteriota bacterium]
MLTKKVQEALNEQLNAELFSAYLYLSMSAYFRASSLEGFAHWMRMQTEEERGHAMKIYNYIQERNSRVVLKAIGAPTKEWKSPLAAIEAAYEHEQKITELINDLVNLSIKAGDHATHIFLQWFVTEQVEESAAVGGVLEKLRLVGETPSGLFIIDNELGKRTIAHG